MSFPKSYRDLHNKLSCKTIHPKLNSRETLVERLERQRLEDLVLEASIHDDAVEFFDNLLDESHLIKRVVEFRSFGQ